ncbi:MAG: hypothetical protein V8R97_02030 [Fusicatenibacter saccharivorans]
MAVADKIKALLKLQGKKTEDLAEALGLASKQALYNKLHVIYLGKTGITFIHLSFLLHRLQ